MPGTTAPSFESRSDKRDLSRDFTQQAQEAGKVLAIRLTGPAFMEHLNEMRDCDFMVAVERGQDTVPSILDNIVSGQTTERAYSTTGEKIVKLPDNATLIIGDVHDEAARWIKMIGANYDAVLLDFDYCGTTRKLGPIILRKYPAILRACHEAGVSKVFIVNTYSRRLNPKDERMDWYIFQMPAMLRDNGFNVSLDLGNVVRYGGGHSTTPMVTMMYDCTAFGMEIEGDEDFTDDGEVIDLTDTSEKIAPVKGMSKTAHAREIIRNHFETTAATVTIPGLRKEYPEISQSSFYQAMQSCGVECGRVPKDAEEAPGAVIYKAI